MKNFIKYKLFKSIINPVFILSSITANLVVFIDFLFIHKFFSGSGTTNLGLLFNSIPFVSIFIVPVLSHEEKNIFEEAFPIKSFYKQIFGLISVFLQYIFIIVPVFGISAFINLFGDVDSGQIFTSFLSMLFFGLAVISICRLFEELFSKGIAAVITNIAVLLCFSCIHLLLLYFNFSDFLVKAAKSISFSWHFESASKGILDSRDIFYFIFIAAFSNFLNFIFAEFKKGFVLKGETKYQTFGFVLVLVFALLNTKLFYARKDFSKNHKLTVSTYSKQLINSLESPLSITYYKSRILTSLYPEAKDISDFLYEFSGSKKVLFRETEPVKSKEESALADYGIYPRQIQTLGNNKTEYVNVYSSIVLEYGGVCQIIPFILAGNSLEFDLDSRLCSLVSEKQNIVNLLLLNGKSLQNDYGYVTPWLNSQNFIVNEIDISGNVERQLSYGNSMIVIGSENADSQLIELIRNYIEKDGRVIFFVSPYNVDIENSWFVTETKNRKLINFLESYGFGFGECLIADVSCPRITMESSQNSDGTDAGNSYSRQINYPLWISLLSQQNSKNGITMFWPAEISANDEDASVCLLSSSSSWKIKPDYYSAENLFQTNPFLLENALPGNEKKQNPLALVSKKKNIMLVPDQYFLSSLMMGYIGGAYGDYRNLDFVANQLLKMNGEIELAELQEKSSLSANTSLFKTYDKNSFMRAKAITLVYAFGIVPFIYILFAAMFCRARKRFFR